MKSAALVLLPLVIAVTLVGCTPTPSLWSEADARKEITVHRVELVHDVAFASNSAEIAIPEQRRLDQFLARQHVGYGDTVEIRTPGNDTRLDARRAAAVSSYFARNGVIADRVAGTSPTEVRVTVSRSVAVPPPCPDWRKPANDGDPGNTPMSNFGCANTRNLGLMIADPSELVAGRPMSPGSGQPLAAGINRYREGQIKPLTPFTESSSSSPTGGAQ